MFGQVFFSEKNLVRQRDEPGTHNLESLVLREVRDRAHYPWLAGCLERRAKDALDACDDPKKQISLSNELWVLNGMLLHEFKFDKL